MICRNIATDPHLRDLLQCLGGPNNDDDDEQDNDDDDDDDDKTASMGTVDNRHHKDDFWGWEMRK
jgi:hypothetical protein